MRVHDSFLSPAVFVIGHCWLGDAQTSQPEGTRKTEYRDGRVAERLEQCISEGSARKSSGAETGCLLPSRWSLQE
jgi:hypothetical protein